MKFTWKTPSTNSVIPTNSRPFTNNDPNLATLKRKFGDPNPIKHWRKQLMPYYATKSSKQVSLDTLNAPGSVVYTNYDSSNTFSCSSENSQLLKENITLLNDCLGIRDISGNRCVGGSSKVRRSASTNLKKNYYRNYSKYLQAKCKTYDSKSSLGEKNSDGMYKGSKCVENSKSCIVYKPSNKAFNHQGSVSSSANILRKRNNAIINNSHSLKSAYGNSIVHAVNYFDPNDSVYKIRYVKGDNTSNQLCSQQFKDCSTSG